MKESIQLFLKKEIIFLENFQSKEVEIYLIKTMKKLFHLLENFMNK